MINCISYQRFSYKDKRKSGSIEAQHSYNVDFCERQRWNVVCNFSDEGKTGSNFERSGWKEMVSFLKANKGLIQYVVCYRFDRIARSAGEAISLISKLEKRFDLVFVSSTEHIGINPKSPAFFKWRADKFVEAEYMLKVIKEQIVRGVRRGREDGRICRKAAYGWINERDSKGRAIIIPHPEESKVVKKMFEDFVYGELPLFQVRDIAKESGFNRKSKSAVRRVLENINHCGQVVVPQFYERESYITELNPHYQIVPKNLFWSAQNLLNGCKKKATSVKELPLRGLIHSEATGTAFTGGRSRGKMGKYYWYYRDNYVTGQNYSAIKAHSDWEGILEKLSLSKTAIERLREKVLQRIEEGEKERNQKLSLIRKQVNETKRKIEQLEKKFIESDSLSDSVYRKWRVNYESELMKQNKALQGAQISSGGIYTKFEKHFKGFIDLKGIWEMCDLQNKRKLFSSIFSEKVYLTKTGYRTQKILPFLRHKALSISNLHIEELQEKTGKSYEIPVSTRNGTIIELALPTLEVFEKLKIS